MTTQEFNLRLENANDMLSLCQLRASGIAPVHIKRVKEKAVSIEGFTRLSCSTSTLKQIMKDTNTNSFEKVFIPTKNRVLKAFADKEVYIYINQKLNKGDRVEILVKVS